jgi:hypothetical protein
VTGLNCLSWVICFPRRLAGFIPFFLLFLSYSLAFMGVEGYGAGAWDS